MAEKVVSPAWSLEGWNLWEFIKGRKKMIITIIGTVGGWIVTENPALTGIIGGLTELLVAVIEFGVKKVTK